MTYRTTTILGATLALLLAGSALAHEPNQHRRVGQAAQPPAAPGTTMTMHHDMQIAPGADKAPSTPGYLAAMDRMMKDMPAITGNADRDFALQMIPHHQAAIDMARVQLAHGRNPGMRRLANEVIAAQEKEITELRTFLAK